MKAVYSVRSGKGNMLDYNELDKKARLGAFSTFDAEVLVPEVQKLKSNEIYLEIGVDKGKSLSIARMVAEPDVVICGVDIQKDPLVEGTRFWQGKSADIARQWEYIFNMWKISVLFIDGDHSYRGCKTDIDFWYPHMKKNGVLLFHDCDESSPGVLQAVSEFVNNHTIPEFKLFKRTDKNTSMAKIQL